MVGMQFGLAGTGGEGSLHVGLGIREPMRMIRQQGEHMMCLGVRFVLSQHAVRQLFR